MKRLFILLAVLLSLLVLSTAFLSRLEAIESRAVMYRLWFFSENDNRIVTSAERIYEEEGFNICDRIKIKGRTKTRLVGNESSVNMYIGFNSLREDPKFFTEVKLNKVIAGSKIFKSEMTLTEIIDANPTEWERLIEENGNEIVSIVVTDKSHEDVSAALVITYIEETQFDELPQIEYLNAESTSFPLSIPEYFKNQYDQIYSDNGRELSRNVINVRISNTTSDGKIEFKVINAYSAENEQTDYEVIETLHGGGDYAISIAPPQNTSIPELDIPLWMAYISAVNSLNEDSNNHNIICDLLLYLAGVSRNRMETLSKIQKMDILFEHYLSNSDLNAQLHKSSISDGWLNFRSLYDDENRDESCIIEASYYDYETEVSRRILARGINDIHLYTRILNLIPQANFTPVDSEENFYLKYEGSSPDCEYFVENNNWHIAFIWVDKNDNMVPDDIHREVIELYKSQEDSDSEKTVYISTKDIRFIDENEYNDSDYDTGTVYFPVEEGDLVVFIAFPAYVLGDLICYNQSDGMSEGSWDNIVNHLYDYYSYLRSVNEVDIYERDYLKTELVINMLCIGEPESFGERLYPILNSIINKLSAILDNYPRLKTFLEERPRIPLKVFLTILEQIIIRLNESELINFLRDLLRDDEFVVKLIEFIEDHPRAENFLENHEIIRAILYIILSGEGEDCIDMILELISSLKENPGTPARGVTPLRVTGTEAATIEEEEIEETSPLTTNMIYNIDTDGELVKKININTGKLPEKERRKSLKEILESERNNENGGIWQDPPFGTIAINEDGKIINLPDLITQKLQNPENSDHNEGSSSCFGNIEDIDSSKIIAPMENDDSIHIPGNARKRTGGSDQSSGPKYTGIENRSQHIQRKK